MEERFTDAQIADFLRRSYFVVDGLWFVKTEEAHGIQEAMELDEAVWDVMCKVQARKAKSLLAIENGGPAELGRAFQLKFVAEGYAFDADIREEEARLTVRVCPWFEILRSSNRTHIAEVIADRICAREYAGWAREFGPGIEVVFERRLCVEGCETCSIVFRKVVDAESSSG